MLQREDDQWILALWKRLQSFPPPHTSFYQLTHTDLSNVNVTSSSRKPPLAELMTPCLYLCSPHPTPGIPLAWYSEHYTESKCLPTQLKAA